jgi:hypothetical protein
VPGRRSPVVPLALLLVACDGQTGAPVPAPPPSADAAATPVAAFACSLGSTMAEIERRVFRAAKCAVCHSKIMTVPTSLDLVSDGLAGRMVDKRTESSPARGLCAGRVLVGRNDPLGGVLVEKVEKRVPSCGAPMPQGLPHLSEDEISCVKLWATLAAAQ